MKLPLILLGIALAAPLGWAAESPKLVRLWETEPDLKVPEGVHFDAERDVLYVSNIEGTEPWAKDGAGSIAKVALDGRIIEVEWIQGLHAPKGIARHGDRLYVADIDRLIVVDITEGKIVQQIEVPGAERLNDVSADSAGTIYVTDSKTGVVHQLRGDDLSVFTDAFEGPNGVLATRDGLFVLDQETLHRVRPDGTPEPIVEGIEGHVDGVEQDRNGFVVTCWEGIIYYARPGEGAVRLLDTRAEKVNAADLAFDPTRRILYVPTFWENTVVAYQLQ